MTKIFIDPGHGGSDSGATGNGLFEKNINLDIALKTRDILNQEYEGHTIMMSRTNDVYVSLNDRTNMANQWGADYLISIHCNAGGGSGFESYIYNGSYSGKEETDRLRSIIHDDIVSETGFYDRGKKEANFHMLRESWMPASLTENGFIDHASDAEKLGSDAFREKVARGHAEGLALALGLTKKEQSNVYYRVVAGSFSSKENAEQRVAALSDAGFESFIVTTQINGTTYYRVIAGSFQRLENAEEREAAVEAAGFDAFIDVYEA